MLLVIGLNVMTKRVAEGAPVTVAQDIAVDCCIFSDFLIL